MQISAKNAPHALTEMMWRLNTSGFKASSRNGEVLSIEEPVTLTVDKPMERVLVDPVRDANPFFHVAETVWMLGGGQGIEFVSYYNSGMVRYSDDGATFHGAYGHRWRSHFYRDQIVDTIEHLRQDPDSRRAVISMWDAEVDGNPDKATLDMPCNTQLFFRLVSGKLNMTVINRSNDIVWGMCGANIVHMTYLQELVAHGVGCPVGVYRVFTNNAHAYTANPQVEALLSNTQPVDTYLNPAVHPTPMLQVGEHYQDLLDACSKAVSFPWEPTYGVSFLDDLYVPVRNVYRSRKDKRMYKHNLEAIVPSDWRLACTEWCERREKL